MTTNEIALLVGIVLLAVYCAIISRLYANLSAQFEALARRYADLAEKHKP